jgi:hypothetical protein
MTRLKAFLKLLSWSLKIFCAIFVIVLPLLAAYDYFSPWQPAVKARANYGNALWINVALGFGSTTRKTGEIVKKESHIQRSYAVFSDLLATPKIVTVSQDQDGRISVEESVFAFWFLLFTTLACGWVAWRYLYQPWLKRRFGEK